MILIVRAQKLALEEQAELIEVRRCE